jgi:hypothetical protein
VTRGPSSGRFDLGPGDDYVDTSLSSGSFLIICGPGRDQVMPGPRDTVSKDCERRGTADGEPQRPSPAKPEYSLAGVCGVKNGTRKTPRCYVMLGAGLIRAIKRNEGKIASGVSSLAASATSHVLDDLAKQIALDAAKKQAVRQVKNRFINYSVRKLAGELAAKGVSAGARGFSFGTMMGKATALAITATRWSHLEAKGYPHKCFLIQLSYADGKPKIAIDPVFSFVRSWDHENPPSYRGIDTSMGRWEKSSGRGATLPLFCSGVKGRAVALKGSAGLDELLSPPYVRFAITFDAS